MDFSFGLALAVSAGFAISFGFGCSFCFGGFCSFFALKNGDLDLLLDGLWVDDDMRLGKVSKGTCGSRKLSRVGRGLKRGIAAPYVIYINSSAGNITYIPGPLDSLRRASRFTYTENYIRFVLAVKPFPM